MIAITKNSYKKAFIVSAVIITLAILGYGINKLSHIYDEKRVINNIYVSK